MALVSMAYRYSMCVPKMSVHYDEINVKQFPRENVERILMMC